MNHVAIGKRLNTWNGAVIGMLFFASINSVRSEANLHHLSESHASNGVEFEEYKIRSRLPKHATLITGSFLGNASTDIALACPTGESKSEIEIYSDQGKEWNLSLKSSVQVDIQHLDKGMIQGQEYLAFYTDQGILLFDPDTKNTKTVIEKELNPENDAIQSISPLDFLRDLNHDGQDDCILLLPDRIEIYLQKMDGSFSDAFIIADPSRSEGLDFRREQIQKIHNVDWNLDQKTDLVFWQSGEFKVFLQNEDNRFHIAPTKVSCPIKIQSVGTGSQQLEKEGDNMMKLLLGFRKKIKQTALASFQDLNADGYSDLITHSLEGRSLLRLKIVIETHMSQPTPSGIGIPKAAASTVSPSGKQPKEYSNHQFQDLNGDGQLDLILTSVDAGIGDMFEALTANTIDLDLEFYLMNNGKYPPKPTTTRRIAPKSHWFSKNGPFFPSVLIGDINGDRFLDLAVGYDWKELRIYEGIQGKTLFAKQAQKFRVNIPTNEQNARLVDLNLDGKKDILFHQASPSINQEITLLITK